MEPSTGKFTVATSAPAVYNVAGLSCANWHFSVHKSPKKKSPSSPILWGLASCIQNDLNFLIREDIRYSPPVICKLPDFRHWKRKLKGLCQPSCSGIYLIVNSYASISCLSIQRSDRIKKQEMNEINWLGAMNRNRCSGRGENIGVNLLFHWCSAWTKFIKSTSLTSSQSMNVNECLRTDALQEPLEPISQCMSDPIFKSDTGTSFQTCNGKKIKK